MITHISAFILSSFPSSTNKLSSITLSSVTQPNTHISVVLFLFLLNKLFVTQPRTHISAVLFYFDSINSFFSPRTRCFTLYPPHLHSDPALCILHCLLIFRILPLLLSLSCLAFISFFFLPPDNRLKPHMQSKKHFNTLKTHSPNICREFAVYLLPLSLFSVGVTRVPQVFKLSQVRQSRKKVFLAAFVVSFSTFKVHSTSRREEIIIHSIQFTAFHFFQSRRKMYKHLRYLCASI